MPDGSFLPVSDWQCDTEQMQLELSIPNYEVIIDWQTSDGSIVESDHNNVVISAPGQYTATLYNPESHCTTSISTIVENSSDRLEDFEIEKSDIYCYGSDSGQLSLSNIQSGDSPLTLYINGNEHEGGMTLNALAPGHYSIDLVDDNGCLVQKEVEIVEFPEVEIVIPTEIDVIYETADIISAQLSEGREKTEVVWTNSDGSLLGNDSNLEISVSENTMLKVKITDIHGCVLEKEVLLKVRLADEVYIPNIFSPNGDGDNDFFTAFSVKSPGLIESLNVYDRWGNIIYTASGLELGNESDGWDGTYNGRQLVSDTYIYSATINNGANQLETIYGSVTLIR